MATRTVSGVLRKPVTNALWTSAMVLFRLTRPFAIAGATYPTQSLEVTTDAVTAVLSVTLAVPTTGSARYECVLPDKRNFVFYLAAGVGTVNFEDLVAGGFADEEAGESLQAIIDNHAATGHLTAAQEAAIDGANAPSGANVFATMADLGGGGVDTFLELTDTPNAYTGAANRPVTVKVDESGLEFPAALQSVTDDERAALDAAPIPLTAANYVVSKDHLTEHESFAATAFILGHIKVGSGLAIDGGGVLSVSPAAQPQDAELTAIAGLVSAADTIPYFTGLGTAALATFTGFARTILDDANQAAVQATLGLVPGTNVQAFDAELSAIAGLISAADKLPYFTGLGTAALADFTAAGRALVDDADAAAQRTTLGLVAAGAGDIWVEKAGDTMTGVLLLPSGTVDNPSLAFSAEAGLGMYRVGASDIGFASNGATIALINYAVAFTLGSAFALAWSSTSQATGTVDLQLGRSSGNFYGLRSSALTNTAATWTFRHNSSGAPAAGFGSTLAIQGKSSTTDDQDMMGIATTWVTATHASRAARAVFNVYDTAAREAMRIEASGTAPMIGFLGAAAVVRQANIVDADGTLADITTKFNTLLGYLESFGLIAA